jgi:hypothetical protein
MWFNITKDTCHQGHLIVQQACLLKKKYIRQPLSNFLSRHPEYANGSVSRHQESEINSCTIRGGGGGKKKGGKTGNFFFLKKKKKKYFFLKK